MLRWILIVGGLLIMMGHHARSEALLYYFGVEDQIPKKHLLRLIDRHISFEFVRQQLKASYSDAGRPSVDPELLLRILLIGYLYGISSERKLVEELPMHLAWRFFAPERFTYEPEHDRYICPAGQPLNYGGRSHRNHAWTYIGTRKRCGPCPLRPQCTSAAFRCLVVHQHEPARRRARELVNTPEFVEAQGQRKKVGALFAELKNQIGLRRLRLRHLKFVREQFWLAAAAQNIKRLVRFLDQQPHPILPATT